MKRPISHFSTIPISFICIILGFSSCSRNATPRVPLVSSDGDSADATFVVDTPISLVQSKQINGNAAWSIPTANSMTFHACIKDVAKLEPVISQSYNVRTDSGTKTLVTDPTGCFSWTEVVPFDAAQPETYAQSEHWIEGTGGPYRGSRHISIAVDPWLTSSDALMDLRQGTQTAPKLVQGKSATKALLSASSQSEQAGLVLPNITVQSNDIRYVSDSAILDLKLILKPTYGHRTLQDTVSQMPIHSGQFQIELSLIERRPDQKNDQLIIRSQKTDTVSLVNDEISYETKISLDGYKPQSTSILEVAFKLSAVNAPSTLLPEEGRIQLSGLTEGSNVPVLKVGDGFTLPTYLAKAVADTVAAEQLQVRTLQVPATSNLGGSSSSCDDGSDKLGLFLNKISAQNLGISARAQDSNVPAQVIAGFTVCLASSVDRSPIAGHHFEVDLGGNSQTLESDDNGCIRFTEPVDFDYYASEGWSRKTLRVASQDAPFSNVTREFPVFIDPWTSNDSFFWDCRSGVAPQFKTKPARLEMTDLAYTYVGRAVKIDRAMNLTLTRHYQFQITPRLARSQGYSGLTGYETVTDGKFHLRALMLAPNADQDLSALPPMDNVALLATFKYLSSFEADVQARDGKIIQDVALPVLFQDLPLLETRNLMLVQISPIDPASKLVSKPFYSQFFAATDSGLFGLMPSLGLQSPIANQDIHEINLDLASLIDLGSKSKALLSTENTGISDLANQVGLAVPSDSDLAAASVTAATMKSLISSTPTTLTLQKLCKVVNAQNPNARNLSTCLENPSLHLEIARLEHVEGLDRDAALVDSSYLPMTVAASLSTYQSATNATAHGTSDSDEKYANDGSEKHSGSDTYSSTDHSSNQNTFTTHQTHTDSDDFKTHDVHASVDAYAGASVSSSQGIDVFGNSAKVTEDAGVRASAGTGISSGHTDKSGSSLSGGTTISKTDSKVTGERKDQGSSVFSMNGWMKGKQWFMSTSLTASKVSSATGSISYSRNFGIEELTFALNGRTRLCIAARLKKSTNGGVLLCESAAGDQKQWTENYYLISELLNGGAANLRDIHGNSDAPWVKAIRGKKAFEHLKTELTDRTRQLVLSPSKIGTDKMTKAAPDEFGRTTPLFSDGALPAFQE